MADYHTFDSHADYVRTQIGLTRRKKKRDDGRFNLTTTKAVIGAVVSHYRQKVGADIGHADHRGLCHGVRDGQELDLFQQADPDGSWIGSELTPELCDGQRIIEHDFTQVCQSWLRQFDLIYSNCLDHARDPEETLRVWLGQVSPRGFLYVEWQPWSAWLGKRGNRADCFAASQDEYRELMQRVGHLDAELIINDSKQKRRNRVVLFKRHVFAVRSREAVV